MVLSTENAVNYILIVRMCLYIAFFIRFIASCKISILVAKVIRIQPGAPNA